jgi:16S rRNA (uracil1498-N3)-methyltransferase
VYRLKAGEARHLSRVCRLGAGDEVEIFDGRGGATRAKVIALGVDRVDLIAVGAPIPERVPPFPLVLASAVPKADRFDWLVEKATELGVERLIPLICERSVVEPGSRKISRLERTIIEASKQCRRSRLMVLEPPVRWPLVAESVPQSLKFFADMAGVPTNLVERIPTGQPVILAIGPEGGFTEAERELAGRTGWLGIELGVNTLRIETAGLAGCAALFTRAKEPNE